MNSGAPEPRGRDEGSSEDRPKIDDAALTETCSGITKAQAEGALKHRIAATFPLRELAKAHAFAENHTGTGHVVVEIE
jgi:NADPH:quinone reductase-like Zn-dependent oxidoreductase